MEGYTIIVLIIGAVLAVFGGLTILIPYLVKKGIDVSGVLSGTSGALDTAQVVVTGLKGLFPETEAYALIDKIIGYAKQATAAAEQLYKTHKIEADQRNAEATKIVYECLGIAGIETTEDIKKIVNGCIEAAVFALPKTHATE